MKKLALILSATLLLSFNLSATRYLVCNGGKAAIIDTGAPGGTTFEWAGGCCCGNWITTLRPVAPTGNPNPNVPEANSDIYSALNTPPENPSEQLTESDKAAMLDAISNGEVSEAWIDPSKLNADAYSLVYGGTTYIPLFYANTSINIYTNRNVLTLYSDNDRDINVTYQALDLTVVGSEPLHLVRGYNSKTLSTASLSNGTYIITVSTDGDYEVNLTLRVSH